MVDALRRISRLGDVHMENLIIQFLLHITDKLLGIIVFSTRFKNLSESNKNANIEYLVSFLLPFGFVENVCHGKRGAGFGHDETPDTHRKEIANLA